MGIKGLKTFLCEYKIGYYESIAELAEKYRNNRRNTGFPDTKDVKIVVDANTCQQVTYKLADHFVGYEIQEYVNRVREFVEDFKKLGIELVFFFSDVISAEEERQGNIAKLREAFECLVTENYLPNSYHLTLPSSRFTSVSILKYVFGCEVRYVTTKSSREAILEYIREQQQCFAILTDNTEFVACQTGALVLSSHHLKRTNMSTINCYRIMLANVLGIHIHELPLLAILAGSDTDISPEIESFHRRCVSHNLSYCLNEIPAIELLRVIVAVIHQLRKHEHIEIILDVLGSKIMVASEKKDLFKKNYYSYFLPNTYRFSIASFPTGHWSSLLIVAENRYRACIIPTDVYTVLSKQKYHDILTFDDLSNATLTRDEPSFKVLQPLRRRLYGILLSEKESSLYDPVAIQEWKYGVGNLFCAIPIVVTWPTKPIVPHPGLIALWHEFNDNINMVRWTLFLKTISPSLDVARWQSFDEELLLPTLSVYHLYDTKYLNESEVDAVLVTIAMCGLPVEVLPDASFDIRVCNISIALYRTFTLVFNILAACGYPVQLSENNAYLKFESRLFKFNYTATMEKTADIRALFQNNDYCYCKFKRMKDIINETENDKLSDDLARMEV